MSTALQNLPIIERLGWTLLHSVWQWAVVGAVAWLLLRSLHRRSPQARYLAAVSLLAAGTIASAVTFVLGTPTSQLAQLEDDSVRTTAMMKDVEISTIHSVTADTNESELTVSPSETGSSAAAIGFEMHQPTSTPINESIIETGLREQIQSWLPYFVFVWLAGVALLSTRMGVSWVRLQSLTRRHVTPIAASLRSTADQLCERLRIPSTVKVVESVRVHVPMAVGWLRPVVLLPASIVVGLAPDQLEALLAHELAHLARRDYLVNLAQCVVEILFFYHPVVWRLSRTIRQEREEACDDLALSILKSRTVYAKALTELASRNLGNPAIAVAANSGSLSHRIERLLFPQEVTQRHTQSTSAGMACLLFLFAAMVVLAGMPGENGPLETAIAAAADETSLSVTPSNPSGALLPGNTPRDEPTISLPEFGGTVVDSSGKPALGDVDLIITSGRTDSSTGDPSFGYRVASTTCKNGRFQFPAMTIPNPEQDGDHPYQIDVVARSPGNALGWWHIQSPSPVEIKLRPEATLHGRVLNGNVGVAGATVSIERLLTKGELAWKAADLKHRIDARHPQEIELGGLLQTTTNAQGEFEIAGLPQESGVVLDVAHADFVRQRVHAATSRLNKEALKRDLEERVHPRHKSQSSSNNDWAVGLVQPKLDDIEVSPVTAKIRRGIDVEIRVLDEETRKPIAGAKLPRVGRVFDPNSTQSTDENGVARYENLTFGRMDVRVSPPNNTEYLDSFQSVELVPEEWRVTVEIPLRKGVLINGTVVDRKSKVGVGGGHIYYVSSVSTPRKVPGKTRFGSQPHVVVGADGKFQLAVPAGVAGKLILNGPIPGYRTYVESGPVRSAPAEFGKEIQAEAGKSVNVTFELDRAPALIARLLDPDGNPVAGVKASATIYWQRDQSRGSWERPETGLSDAQGRLIMSNLFVMTEEGKRRSLGDGELLPIPFKDQSHVELTLLHDERHLGARIGLDFPADGADMVRDIRLERLGSVTLEVVDSESKQGIPYANVEVYRRTTEPLQRSIVQVNDSKYTDADGVFKCDRLIPGVEHWLNVFLAPTQERKSRVSAPWAGGYFRVAPGETYDAGTVEFPSSDPQQVVAKLSEIKIPDVEGLDARAAYDKLLAQFQVDMQRFRDEREAAKSDELRRIIVQQRDPTSAYANAFFKLGQGDSDPAIACKALVWVVTSLRYWTTENDRNGQLLRDSADLLLERDIARPELADAAYAIFSIEMPDEKIGLHVAEILVERVAKANNDRLVQAKFYCALAERYRPNCEPARREATPIEKSRHNEVLTLLRDKFGDLPGPYDMSTIREYAERELFELNELQVGQMAPELKGIDLEGNPMALADFRGKIVVVCYRWRSGKDDDCADDFDELQKYFQQRSPGSVVVLSVCADKSREAALAEARQQSYSFKSWFDGPEHVISRRWNTRGWPYYDVIDAAGKIRFRTLNGLEDTGPAVQHLLDEQQRGTN